LTRKQYSPEQKLQIIKEAIETGNASIVARRHDISASLVGKWVRQYKRRETSVSQGGKQRKTHSNCPVTIEEHKKMISETKNLKSSSAKKSLK